MNWLKGFGLTSYAIALRRALHRGTNHLHPLPNFTCIVLIFTKVVSVENKSESKLSIVATPMLLPLIVHDCFHFSL